jgi:hypothetical protein
MGIYVPSLKEKQKQIGLKRKQLQLIEDSLAQREYKLQKEENDLSQKSHGLKVLSIQLQEREKLLTLKGTSPTSPQVPLDALESQEITLLNSRIQVCHTIESIRVN